MATLPPGSSPGMEHPCVGSHRAALKLTIGPCGSRVWRVCLRIKAVLGHDSRCEGFPAGCAAPHARYYRPVWAASFLLAPGGTAWVALAPSSLSYWLGTSFYVPLALLITCQAQRKGFESEGAFKSPGDDGPWGPP